MSVLDLLNEPGRIAAESAAITMGARQMTQAQLTRAQRDNVTESNRQGWRIRADNELGWSGPGDSKFALYTFGIQKAKKLAADGVFGGGTMRWAQDEIRRLTPTGHMLGRNMIIPGITYTPPDRPAPPVPTPSPTPSRPRPAVRSAPRAAKAPADPLSGSALAQAIEGNVESARGLGWQVQPNVYSGPDDADLAQDAARVQQQVGVSPTGVVDKEMLASVKDAQGREGYADPSAQGAPRLAAGLVVPSKLGVVLAVAVPVVAVGGYLVYKRMTRRPSVA